MDTNVDYLELERWQVFKQAMVILGVNEEYFSLMYEKAFLTGEITIDQIREEILYNIDDIQQEKLRRIEYQEIALTERARLLEKAKQECRLKWSAPQQPGGIIVEIKDKRYIHSLEAIKPEHLSLLNDYVAGGIATYEDLFNAWREATPLWRPNQHVSVGYEEQTEFCSVSNVTTWACMEFLLLELGRQLGVSDSTLRIYSGDY